MRIRILSPSGSVLIGGYFCPPPNAVLSDWVLILSIPACTYNQVEGTRGGESLWSESALGPESVVCPEGSQRV